MAKLSLSNDYFVERGTGLPVEGRLKIYDNDTDVLSTVYTLEGTEFVECVNPALIHAGFLDDTRFLEFGLYTLKVEKFIGIPGTMSAESEDSEFAPIDQFKFGTDFDDDVGTAHTVAGIAELRNADPELGSVTVNWYDEPGDCFPRTYVWDPDAVNNEDGGYVIASNVSDSGRWILMWGDEILPCTVYGVHEGAESNINLLLNYPAMVGSFGMLTAPCVRFTSGAYGSSVTYSTTKEIVFDNDVVFAGATFVCPRARFIGDGSLRVADFRFTATDMVAHSSWFRTLDAFWHCGANTLMVDTVNGFADTKLRSTVDLQGKTVHGYNSLVTEYVNGAYFKVGLTSHVPDKFFSTSDFVQVLSAGMGDEIFKDAGAWDPGSIAQGHHVLYSQVPELELFRSADRWLATMIERRARLSTQVWDLDTIDLQGRTVNTFELAMDSFGNVRNGTIDGYVVKHGGSLGLTNVNGGVTLDGATLAVANSTVHVTADSNNVSSISSVDTLLTLDGANGIDPTDTTLTVAGGHLTGNIRISDAHANSYGSTKQVTLRNVVVDGHWNWRVAMISMSGCDADVRIELLPVLADGLFYYNCDIADNRFYGASRIQFTVFVNALNPHPELDGALRFNMVRIVGNRFDGSDVRAIRRLHWNPETLNKLWNDADHVGAWEYRGNTGSCPKMGPGYLNNLGKWNTVESSGGYGWLLHDDGFFVWCPYLTYGDGSIQVARDPSGVLVNELAPWALVFSELGGGGHATVYGYRTAASPVEVSADPYSEDVNDTFFVRLAMTDRTATPATPAGTTLYPLPQV